MLRILEYLLLAVGMAAIIIASYWVGQQAYTWMPAQVTAEAQRVDDLFSFLVAVGAFVFLGVVSMIVYSIIAYRAPKGDYSEGHPARGDEIYRCWCWVKKDVPFHHIESLSGNQWLQVIGTTRLC